ncbi:MAG: Hpt domain-containing protein [Coriobacteriia bacterium]|nr:Hpt domain-containing protein [Coriobacteriia bacterium]
MESERITVCIDSGLEELIPRYLKRRREDVVRIREALDEGHLEDAQTIGHKMRGSGGGYGFDALTDIGGQIETAAVVGDTAAIWRLAQTLEDYLARIDVRFVDES